MSLMCDYGDYEEPSIYSATTQRARKEYCCDECRQTINHGDTYVRIFGVWDGDARTYFHCERCDDLIAAFTDVGYCYEIGGFLSSYAEWLDEAGKPRPPWLTSIFDAWREKREAARKEQPHD